MQKEFYETKYKINQNGFDQKSNILKGQVINK